MATITPTEDNLKIEIERFKLELRDWLISLFPGYEIYNDRAILKNGINFHFQSSEGSKNRYPGTKIPSSYTYTIAFRFLSSVSNRDENEYNADKLFRWLDTQGRHRLIVTDVNTFKITEGVESLNDEKNKQFISQMLFEMQKITFQVECEE